MKIEISEEVLLRTNCCRNDKICLNGEINNCCKVINCVNGQVHFVEPVVSRNCNSQISFGGSCFCICPTRKEIYNKYKE